MYALNKAEQAQWVIENGEIPADLRFPVKEDDAVYTAFVHPDMEAELRGFIK